MTLDPRWEWAEVMTGDGDSWFVKTACRHLEVVPVQSAGQTVAHLCQTCDVQLPAEWRATRR